MQPGRTDVARLPWLVLLATLASHAIGIAHAAPWPVAPRADIEVFTREGCPHCDDAIRWLDELRARRPDVTVLVTDVGADPTGRARFASIAEQTHTAAVSVPSFWVRRSLVVGFASGATTGARIETLLAGPDAPPGILGAEGGACGIETDAPCDSTRPGLGTDEVTLPVFGTVRARNLGLPLFTVAIGLVDGFNPCAMWVLLFLLSFLAGLGSRAKMLLIAGEFVLVSAVAYYAFMAAWVAVFSLIGLSRAVQIAFGLIGLFVGAVNVKDFFAFQRGLTFSIPESAKPGIYRRMRAVVRAETLWLALLAAGVLAVLVNFVELLCTAGLPALYAQVLASQQVPVWKRYAYLALYDTAYMLDDMILVVIAVVTLGRRKLQERSGRWLKLLSGTVMLALALVLLFRPAWLSR